MRCPRGLKNPPKKECIEGRNKKCQWYVIDAKANYCMWKWITDRLGDESEVTPHDTIGKALGITGSRVQDIYRGRIEAKLKQWFKDLEGEAEKMVGG